MHVVNMSIRVNRQGLQFWAQMRKELLKLKLGCLNHNISVSPQHRNWKELSSQRMLNVLSTCLRIPKCDFRVSANFFFLYIICVNMLHGRT